MSNKRRIVNERVMKAAVAILIVLGAWSVLVDRNGRDASEVPLVPPPYREQLDDVSEPSASGVHLDGIDAPEADASSADLQPDAWQDDPAIGDRSPDQAGNGQSSSDGFGQQASNDLNPPSGDNNAPNLQDWGDSMGQTYTDQAGDSYGFGQQASEDSSPRGGNNNAPNLQDWGDSMGQTFSDPSDDLQNWGNSMGQEFNDRHSLQQQWGQSMGQNYSQPLNQSSGACDFPGQC